MGHTDRIYIQAVHRICTRCHHPADPLIPLRCIFLEESCPCHAFEGHYCIYDTDVDRKAQTRVIELVRKHGETDIRPVASGWVLTPVGGVVLTRPKAEPRPVVKPSKPTQPQAQRQRVVKRGGDFFSHIIASLEGPVRR